MYLNSVPREEKNGWWCPVNMDKSQRNHHIYEMYFLIADEKKWIIKLWFVCVHLKVNSFKNTRVSDFIQSCYQVVAVLIILIVHRLRMIPEFAIITDTAAVVFKTHECDTHTQRSSGMDKSCRGLSFIVTKPL